MYPILRNYSDINITPGVHLDLLQPKHLLRTEIKLSNVLHELRGDIKSSLRAAEPLPFERALVVGISRQLYDCQSIRKRQWM